MRQLRREESNRGRTEGQYEKIYGIRAFSLRIRVVVWTGENDTETISADANLFKNGTKNSTVFF